MALMFLSAKEMLRQTGQEVEKKNGREVYKPF